MSKVAQLIGETIGNYKLLDVLGEGGMGAVYKAEHILIGKKVALKMLHSEYAQKPEIVRRFFTEAKAVNRIGHRNIVDISDYGQTKEGCPYFIMELLEGKELAKELEKIGALDIKRALKIVRQVASALEASHRAGVVHRDLKPENIFLIELGKEKDFAKVLDFGIAKLQEGVEVLPARHKTKTGMVMGTPAYMAPEQAEASPHIDKRVDIYALGIIFYEMLTGELPFSADTFSRVLIKVLMEPIPSPRIKNPKIPHSIEAVILKMVEKKRDDRFSSMEEMLLALEKAEESLRIDAIDVTGLSTAFNLESSVSNPSINTLSEAAAEMTFTGTGPSRFSVIFGSIISVLSAVAIVSYFMLRNQPPPKIPEPSLQKLSSAAITPKSEPITPLPKKEEVLDKVTIELQSNPEGAMIYQDDEPIGKTPKTIEVDHSNNPEIYKFSLAGYVTKTREITPNKNTIDETVVLEPKPVEPIKKPTAKKSVSRKRPSYVARKTKPKPVVAEKKPKEKVERLIPPKKKKKKPTGPIDSTTTLKPDFSNDPEKKRDR